MPYDYEGCTVIQFRKIIISSHNSKVTTHFKCVLIFKFFYFVIKNYCILIYILAISQNLAWYFSKK